MASIIEKVNNTEENSPVIDEKQVVIDLDTKLDLNKDDTKNGTKDECLDAKQKKKLDKLIDSILKKSSGPKPLTTVDEKYYALASKFMETQEQNKKMQLNGKEMEKTFLKVSNANDYMQTEYSKALLVKEKLESLCRELQKQNRLVKDESIQRIEDEEKKRKEISNKFQGAIDEINSQVSQNSEKNNMLIQENVQLTTKLKDLIEQYETRENQIEKVLKHKDLELQLANAKLQQSELKLTEQTERNKKEKALYDVQTMELNKRCEIHMENEGQLKAQLTVYTQKYEEFQGTLTKSNQVFESFRTEMDKMTRKIKKLESETNTWKVKYESCDKTLKTMLVQNHELAELNKKTQQKSNIMEQLSRSLQTERNTLKQEVKELQDIINPPTPVQEENVEKVIEEENKSEEKAEDSEKPVEKDLENKKDEIESEENKPEENSSATIE
jgi:hypothetical protein